jgi:hypothetical protein
MQIFLATVQIILTLILIEGVYKIVKILNRYKY